jgi:hypothetical protein
MLQDHVYDLMNQLVQESQSLWRIKKHYKKNAEGCKKCVELWEGLERDKERHLKELEAVLKEHF